MRTSHPFLVTVLVLVALGVVLHVVGALPHFSALWGVHFYAFFPAPVLIVATLFLLACVALVSFRPKRSGAALMRGLDAPLRGRRFAVVAPVVLAAAGWLFWSARICHTYLGDGNVIVAEIPYSQLLLEREPLTSQLQYVVYNNLKTRFETPERTPEDVAQEALAVGSVLSGLAFLIFAWLAAREIALLRVDDGDRDDRRALTGLIWLALALQGYIQLFFGYIENYSFYATGVIIYMWLALRYLRGAIRLLAPALALLLCFVLHLSSFVLALAFVALAIPALKDHRRRNSALRDLALAVIGAIGIGVAFSRMRPGYDPLKTLYAMARTAFAGTGGQDYMFSARHVSEFLNEQVLIGPLGLFLFVGAAATLARAYWRRPVVQFCLVAGFSYVAACWAFGDSNLGYPRDWDLLSHSSIVFTTAGLALFSVRRPARELMVAACVCAVLLSAYHTVPWVAVNASPPRSLARLTTLPLSGGQAEVLVSGWYRRQGDREKQREWLDRAVNKYPYNVNAQYLIGVLDYQDGRFDQAITELGRAIALRPDKINFRTFIVRAMYAGGRLSEAAPHLERLVKSAPGDGSVRVVLADALEAMGLTDQARAQYVEAERLLRPWVAPDQPVTNSHAFYGWALFKLGRDREALEYLLAVERALPGLADAHCYLGHVLHDLGRDEEARVHFRQCLDLKPAFIVRPTVESLLQGTL